MVYMVCNSHPFLGDAPCASAHRTPRSVPVTERASEPQVLLTRSGGPKLLAPCIGQASFTDWCICFYVVGQLPQRYSRIHA